MRVMTCVMGVGLLALAGCATTGATQGASPVAANSYCAGLTDLDGQVAEIYSVDRVTRVSPVYLEEQAGPAPNTRAGVAMRSTYLAGAALSLPAERGISSAYMERVLSCHASAGAKLAPSNDPLAVQGVRSVRVREVGATFQVSVTGADADTGRAIWRRAETLKSGSRVEVQQLSSNSPQHPARL